MTLYRYSKNGCLYLFLENKSKKARQTMGSVLEAIPFNHSKTIGVFGSNQLPPNVSRSDFEEVHI
jgi:hypothetical protein